MVVGTELITIRVHQITLKIQIECKKYVALYQSRQEEALTGYLVRYSILIDPPMKDSILIYGLYHQNFSNEKQQNNNKITQHFQN